MAGADKRKMSQLKSKIVVGRLSPPEVDFDQEFKRPHEPDADDSSEEDEPRPKRKGKKKATEPIAPKIVLPRAPKAHSIAELRRLEKERAEKAEEEALYGDLVETLDGPPQDAFALATQLDDLEKTIAQEAEDAEMQSSDDEADDASDTLSAAAPTEARAGESDDDDKVSDSKADDCADASVETSLKDLPTKKKASWKGFAVRASKHRTTAIVRHVIKGERSPLPVAFTALSAALRPQYAEFVRLWNLLLHQYVKDCDKPGQSTQHVKLQHHVLLREARLKEAARTLTLMMRRPPDDTRDHLDVGLMQQLRAEILRSEWVTAQGVEIDDYILSLAFTDDNKALRNIDDAMLAVLDQEYSGGTLKLLADLPGYADIWSGISKSVVSATISLIKSQVLPSLRSLIKGRVETAYGQHPLGSSITSPAAKEWIKVLSAVVTTDILDGQIMSTSNCDQTQVRLEKLLRSEHTGLRAAMQVIITDLQRWRARLAIGVEPNAATTMRQAIQAQGGASCLNLTRFIGHLREEAGKEQGIGLDHDKASLRSCFTLSYKYLGSFLSRIDRSVASSLQYLIDHGHLMPPSCAAITSDTDSASISLTDEYIAACSAYVKEWNRHIGQSLNSGAVKKGYGWALFDVLFRTDLLPGDLFPTGSILISRLSTTLLCRDVSIGNFIVKNSTAPRDYVLDAIGRKGQRPILTKDDIAKVSYGSYYDVKLGDDGSEEWIERRLVPSYLPSTSQGLPADVALSPAESAVVAQSNASYSVARQAYDRLSALQRAMQRAQDSAKPYLQVRSLRAEQTLNGLPMSVKFINSKDRVEELKDFAVTSISRGGLGLEKQVVNEMFEKPRVCGIDPGIRFLIALYFDRLKIDGSGERETVELLLKPGERHALTVSHAWSTADARLSNLKRAEEAQTAKDPRLEAKMASKSHRYIAKQDIALKAKASSWQDSAIREIIQAWFPMLNPDEVYDALKHGPVEGLFVPIGKETGGGKHYLRTADYRTSFLVALIQRCRALNLPVIFVLVDEHCSSCLCPKKECRDSSEYRHDMQAAVWDAGGDSVWRLWQCLQCDTCYNKDLSAAENIAFIFRHLLRFGTHPFKQWEA